MEDSPAGCVVAASASNRKGQRRWRPLRDDITKGPMSLRLFLVGFRHLRSWAMRRRMVLRCLITGVKEGQRFPSKGQLADFPLFFCTGGDAIHAEDAQVSLRDFF